MLLFFQFSSGLLPYTNDSDYNLCNSTFKLPCLNLNLGRTSLRYGSPFAWNRIPISLKKAPSISYFEYAQEISIKFKWSTYHFKGKLLNNLE